MFHSQQNPMCPHHHSPCTAPAALTTNNHSWKEMTMAQSDQTQVQNQRDTKGEPRPYIRQQFAKSLTLHLAEVTTRQEAVKKKTHACTECDKSFGHISNLKKHQRLHTGEKPFVCKLCDKRFNQSAHLKTHMRLHTGEKPFRCDRCDAGFSQLGNLRTHELVHTGEKPLCCERCDKSFSRSDTLRRHQRVHAARESRPFGGCKRRDKCFGQSAAHVSRHQRVHAASEGHLHCEGRRDKTSTESGSLNRHHECLHIGEKPLNSKPWHACFNDLL